jgi:hypothetical protein
MTYTLSYDARYARRRAYAERHGLPWQHGAVWQLPPEAEELLPRPAPLPPLQPEGIAPHIATSALACCGEWHAITQTPLVVPCCGRRYLEATP